MEKDMTTAASSLPVARPWWREPMMWLVLGGPLVVVVAAIVTGFIAWHGADPVVTDLPAQAIHADPSKEPALKGRNHAATPR
jgi:hypothetical protein